MNDLCHTEGILRNGGPGEVGYEVARGAEPQRTRDSSRLVGSGSNVQNRESRYFFWNMSQRVAKVLA